LDKKKGGPVGASLVYKVFLRKRPKIAAPLALRRDNNSNNKWNYASLYPFSISYRKEAERVKACGLRIKTFGLGATKLIKKI
jgi:hypothetical protein